MLLADKEQVVADTKARARRSTTRARSVSSPPVLCLLFQVRLLNVQQLELDYHLSRCLTLGLQATLAAALTYNGIIEIDDAAVRGPMLRLGYYTVTYASTCILLVVAFLTTFCSVRGAGLALRGPDGSISAANTAMALEVHTAHALYLLGLSLLFPSLVFFVWATRPAHIAASVSLALLGVLAILARTARDTHRRFHVRREDVVSARFRPEDFRGRPVQQAAQRVAPQDSWDPTAAAPAPPMPQGGAAPDASGVVAYFRRRSPSYSHAHGHPHASCSHAGYASISAHASAHASGEAPGEAPREWEDDRKDGVLSVASPPVRMASPHGAGHEEALAGYLHKLPSSGRGGAWQRRWVALSGETLQWYASREEHYAGRAPRGEVRLSSQSEVSLCGAGGATELRVVQERRRLVLRADPGADEDGVLERWRGAVEKAVEDAREQRTEALRAVEEAVAKAVQEERANARTR